MDAERTTRRRVLRAGVGAGAAALAGCMGGDSGGETGTATDGGDTSYTVEMAPMGAVEFDGVPGSWIAYDGGYADTGVALGRAEGLTGIGYADRYYTYVYDQLDGVSVDRSRLEENELLGDTIPKEPLLAMDNDVHLLDPQMLVNWFGWDESDLEDVRSNAGPFFGNLVFRRTDEWHDYRYYSLYEAFEKVAQVFDAVDRYEAFAAYHDEFVTSIQTDLPPADDRPNVLLVWGGSDEPERFSPYRLNDKGTSKKQYRDLGISDALAGTGIQGLSTSERGQIDYETMLDVDPDVIMVRGHERKSPQEFRDTVLAFMEDHDVASDLTAVRNGRVYRGGFLYQGPIQNFFQTERAAQQLFPDVFGSVTGDEQLFDRDRVASIVAGDA